MRENPSGGVGGTATATQPLETVQKQLQIERTPQRGMEILFQPADQASWFTGRVFHVHPNSGLDRRVDLDYIDATGQHVTRIGVAYADRPGCWQYNDDLEQEQARVTARRLVHFGILPQVASGMIGETPPR